MQELLGEYECKIDSKGRLRLPSQLLRQLTAFGSSELVVNRGLQKYLTLYPKNVWARESAKVNALNPYVRRNIQFKRYFYRGATELMPDASDRVLLPKTLLEYAEMQKEIVLQGMNDRIEVWSKEAYMQMIEEEPDDFLDMAEEVWGGMNAPNVTPAQPQSTSVHINTTNPGLA